MEFNSLLQSGFLLQRRKRFLVDIELDDGSLVTAHCPNPGSMHGVLQEGNRVWISRSTNVKRKLAYTWEIVEAEGTLIGVNTLLPNQLVEEALMEGRLGIFSSFTTWQREVRYGQSSRIDFLLKDKEGHLCYLEVKNVHMKRGSTAFFPDAATVRGAKHLRELSKLAEQGIRTMIIYVVQRDDIRDFDLAHDIDPSYARASELAHQKGVKSFCYSCQVSPTSIRLKNALSITNREKSFL